MKVNQILLTKDGRVYGNSVVISVNNKGKYNTYDIITDYGHIIKELSRKVIHFRFHVPDMTHKYDIEEHKHFDYVNRNKHADKLPGKEDFFMCDGCNCVKPIREKFKVYDENYKLERGVFNCATCKGLEL